MTFWVFITGVEGWSMDNAAEWDGSEGYPNTGSIRLSPTPGDNGAMSISGLSQSSSSITFWHKREVAEVSIEIDIRADYSDLTYDEDLDTVPTASWQQKEFAINPAKTLTDITINASGNGWCWVDTIVAGEGIASLTHSAGGIPGSILEVSG